MDFQFYKLYTFDLFIYFSLYDDLLQEKKNSSSKSCSLCVLAKQLACSGKKTKTLVKQNNLKIVS